MTISKKEQAAFDAIIEDMKLKLTLRWTEWVAPDLPPPDPGYFGGREMTKGWAFTGECGSYPRVERACSTSIFHAVGQDEKTTSQNSKALYSTKLLALRGLRYRVERECMKTLLGIDTMIEEELKGMK